MPTSGSAGIPDPLPVDVDDSSPIEVNVQEPVSVDDNGGSLTVDGTVTISNLLVDDEYEILCDSNGPFLRQYRTDPSGVITSDNFQLDGVTPYIPFGPVTRCNSVTIPTPVPVTDNGGSLTVDGAVSVTNLRDDEWEILCDSNGSFMRRYRTDSAGVVTSDNFLLDGTTAYVPFGPVTRCNSVTIPTPVPVTDNGGSLTVDGAVSVTNLRDDEFEVLCDSNGPFLRRYRTDSAGVTTSSDFLLNGTTGYVTSGPVTRCNSVTIPTPVPVTDNGGSLTVDDGGGSLTVDGTVNVGNRPDDVEIQVLCDAGAANTPFIRVLRYPAAGGNPTVENRQLDGTTAYAPVGPVVSCQSGATTFRDVNVLVLTDANGSFMRRYVVDNAGAVTVVNTTLDGVTPYVPVAPIRAFPRNTTAIIVTLLSGIATRVSSATARRVTFIFGNNSATAANRPAINGVATLESPNGVSEQINTLVLGSLEADGFVPATTFQTRVAGDSANVIEEF